MAAVLWLLELLLGELLVCAAAEAVTVTSSGCEVTAVDCSVSLGELPDLVVDASSSLETSLSRPVSQTDQKLVPPPTLCSSARGNN